MMRVVLLLFALTIFDFALHLKILPIGKDEKKYEATIRNAAIFQGQAFSICWSTKTQFTKTYIFLTTSNHSSVFLDLRDYIGNGEKLIFFIVNKFGEHRVDISTPEGSKIVPHSWSSFCITFDNQNKELALYFNSYELYNKRNISELQNLKFPTDFLRSLIFPADKSSSILTNLNIWSKILTKEEVKDIYLCNGSSPPPDLVNWENISFSINPENPDIKLTNIDDEESPCEELKEHFYLIDTPVRMVDRQPIRICNALGGSMPVLKNKAELTKLKELNCPIDKGGAAWLPIFKRDNNNWVNHNEKQVSFMGDTSNLDGDCAVYSFVLNKTMIGDCSYTTCFYCQMKSHYLFKLTGIT